jgi:hypothetical protein
MIDLQNCISTICMNQQEAKNQGIPKSHEISIEAHFLHAFACHCWVRLILLLHSTIIH